MKSKLLLFCLLCLSLVSAAGTITGTISNEKGEALPFASIGIKESSGGAIANSKGRYELKLAPGTYTLVCQHVGFKTETKTVTIAADEKLVVDFVLSVQQLTMQEVVVKKGEGFGVTNIMKLTLSCDHRSVDGAVGASFLQTLKKYMENPVMMLV